MMSSDLGTGGKDLYRDFEVVALLKCVKLPA